MKEGKDICLGRTAREQLGRTARVCGRVCWVVGDDTGKVDWSLIAKLRALGFYLAGNGERWRIFGHGKSRVFF